MPTVYSKCYASTSATYLLSYVTNPFSVYDDFSVFGKIANCLLTFQIQNVMKYQNVTSSNFCLACKEGLAYDYTQSNCILSNKLVKYYLLINVLLHFYF